MFGIIKRLYSFTKNIVGFNYLKGYTINLFNKPSDYIIEHCFSCLIIQGHFKMHPMQVHLTIQLIGKHFKLRLNKSLAHFGNKHICISKYALALKADFLAFAGY